MMDTGESNGSRKLPLSKTDSLYRCTMVHYYGGSISSSISSSPKEFPLWFVSHRSGAHVCRVEVWDVN